MSRNSSNNNVPSPSIGPRRSSQWASHLRQFSRTSLDKAWSSDSPRSPDTVSSNSTVREHAHIGSAAAAAAAGTAPSPGRVPERVCTVTINESVLRDDVRINLDLVGGGSIKPGMLMSITVVRPDQERISSSAYGGSVKQARGFPPPTPQPESAKADDVTDRRYIFAVKDVSKETKARQPNIEVYVAKHIGDAFNMRKGTQVMLAPVDQVAPAVEASYVELTFKDMYLSRADMWRLAVSDLVDRTVYKGQAVYFMGTIKATVSVVYVNGRKVQSAFFSQNTKPIFRSESARYVLFIQMSREMWDFDSDGSGEILFYKVVNGFLPALFKKWAQLQVKHLVSIVLFTRIEYDTGLTPDLAHAALHDDYYTGYQGSGKKRPYKDFYRVVVSEMSSGEWTTILHQLKKEYNTFRRDTSLYHLSAMEDNLDLSEEGAYKGTAKSRVRAEASLAMYGNFLEAINLAASQYAHDYIDRDLLRTGISIVVISAGSGVFEVDYDALRRSTEALVGNGLGIDLICMPNVPLHSVPLFRYRNPHYLRPAEKTHPIRPVPSHESTPRQPNPLTGSFTTAAGTSFSPTKIPDGSVRADLIGPTFYADEWAFALPQWLHVSYWTGRSSDALSYHGIALNTTDHAGTIIQDQFHPRCRLYDLQMRSVLETNEIETTPIYSDPGFAAALAAKEKDKRPLRGVHRKTHDGLFETVYGFQKFNPDKLPKGTETSIWQQLQALDDKRSKLPSSRHPTPAKHIRDLEERTRRKLLEEPHVSGVSSAEQQGGPPAITLSSSVASSNNPGADASENKMPQIMSKPRRDSSATMTSINSQTRFPMPKTPKFIRQLSLGQRGFSIAAPKLATAEVRTENVNATQLHDRIERSPSATKLAPMQTALRPATPRAHQASGGLSIKPRRTGPSDESQAMAPNTPSRPIQIRGSSSTASLDTLSTLKAGPILAKPIVKSVRPHDDRDQKFSNALRAEDEAKVYTSKLRAGAMPELPTTLSPTKAMSPWLVVVNPSNPNEKIVDNSVLFSRWQHVFPHPSDMKHMKWKALSCPAAVPLTTEYFPSKHQFDTEYQRSPYSIAQNVDDDMSEEPRSREDLLRELIFTRFAHGFQVVVGPSVAKAFDQRVVRIADIFSREASVEDGTSVFMSVGNTIHQLSCVSTGEVEINIFVRKPADPQPSLNSPTPVYKPAIRTLLDDEYSTSHIDILTPRPEKNWNYIDSFLAGHTDDMSENLRFWRARFVLIPMRRRTASIPQPRTGDDEEEIRLEGIRKLAQLWQRHGVVSSSERQFRGTETGKRKYMNPLDIVYKTDDPSAVVNSELENLPIIEGSEAPYSKSQLVSDRERFSKSKFNVAALADAIQQPVEVGGIKMGTRRWHIRLHYNCFIGSEMTTWLLNNFDDLESREEAVELGNSLMVTDEAKNKEKDKEGNAKDPKKEKDRGIFVHVEKRHPFRDGQYFYQIASEFAKPSTTGWFNARRKEAPSIPPTPLSENSSKDSPRPFAQGTTRPYPFSDTDSGGSATSTPLISAAMPGTKRQKVVLSKMMKFDVDPRKKSYRPERLNLHYDRLHNPDNCFHIRLEWVNTTAKLIEDSIKSWATIATQHGLRLVEVPIAEACKITDTHPLRRPYIIKPVVPPPTQLPAPTYSFNSQSQPSQQQTKHFYEKALLKKFDYVLDVEAASNFPSNVDVSFSWGKPDFKYSQYIHRSGLALAEIMDDGSFLILANRLYSNRAVSIQPTQSARAEPPANDRVSRLMASAAYSSSSSHGGSINELTPISSPMFRPVTFTPGRSRGGAAMERERERDHNRIPLVSRAVQAHGPFREFNFELSAQSLENFCADAQALEAFYKETLDKGLGTPAATPASGATPVMGGISDANIPTLGLPPGILGGVSGGGGGGTATSSSTTSMTTDANVATPRSATPSLSASAMFFRRGSVQQGN